MTPDAPRRRFPSNAFGALLATGLLLSTAACGATARPTAGASTTGTATPTPTARVVDQRAAAATATECTVVSIALSTMVNAEADRREGRLTRSEYAAVLNTVPPALLLQPHGLPATLQAQAEHLRDVVGPATAGHRGPAFDPRSEAVLGALRPLQDACDANGTPTGILATSGG